MRFKSTTLTSYHDLKTKGTSPTCLPCRPFPLLPISRRLSGGSLKVNPRQELSVPPMLVRKVCVKPKDRQKQRTLRRGCGVSFTLPLSLSCPFFSLLSSVSRCDLVACVTERKRSSSPSSYSPGVVIPLLLSSALNANSQAVCKCAQCAAVLPYISLIGASLCVCFLGVGGLHCTAKQPRSVYMIKPIKSGDLFNHSPLPQTGLGWFRHQVDFFFLGGGG